MLEEDRVQDIQLRFMEDRSDWARERYPTTTWRDNLKFHKKIQRGKDEEGNMFHHFIYF